MLPFGRAALFRLAMLPLLALTSCERTMGSDGISACALWPTIYWSRQDTDETIAQARVSNARHEAFCR